MAPHLEIALYRICQELVCNIAKHAQATEANILLVREEGGISLKVRDNGRGIGKGAVKTKGIGLRTILDRVRLLGGILSIARARTSSGTLVSIRIPENA